jgi:hypothetical protein
MATIEAREKSKKYYYIGDYSGKGGDDEFLIKNIKQITYRDYCKLIKTEKQKELKTNFIKEKIETLQSLKDAGYNIEQAWIDKWIILL